MAIFGVQHCGATQAVTDGVKGLSSLAGLGIASIIMIVAIAYDVSGNERGNAIYTLVLSCLSIVIAGGLWFVDTKKPDMGAAIKPLYRFVVLACFAIMWIVAACLVTFDGPFIVSTGLLFGWLSTGCVKSTFGPDTCIRLSLRTLETDISLPGLQPSCPFLPRWPPSNNGVKKIVLSKHNSL